MTLSGMRQRPASPAGSEGWSEVPQHQQELVQSLAAGLMTR
jgi:hypothetical protein